LKRTDKEKLKNRIFSLIISYKSSYHTRILSIYSYYKSSKELEKEKSLSFRKHEFSKRNRSRNDLLIIILYEIYQEIRRLKNE